MSKPILLVMAAGMGSRYGGIKQMDPVGNNGQWIIDYSLYDAKRAGFETVVFVVSEGIRKDFEETIGERIRGHFDARIVTQRLEDLPAGFQLPEGRQKPWGTAHAVYSARDAVDAPFVAINADDFYGRHAYQEIYDYLSTHSDSDTHLEYAMVGYHLGNTISDNGSVSRGVCTTCENGYLLDVTERVRIENHPNGIHFTEDNGESWEPLSADTVVSLNFWGFSRSFMAELGRIFPRFLEKALVENPLKAEFYLPSAVSELVEEDKARVKVLRSHDRWHGVTYQEDRPAVQKAIAAMTAEGLYPDNLWK
ncbi:MAG: NDP-sugar synthase [Oscillospiraceae bacterium]